jgi:AcrR family transcriptional regulator
MKAMKVTATGIRPGGRSARVRHAVLEATLHSLDTQGIENTTINEIAERAGVHETSIYRRWRTREGLILDALLIYSQDQTPVPNTGTLEGDLREYAELHAAHLRTPAGRALLRIFAARGDDPRLDEERHKIWQVRIKRLSVMIKRAVRRGEISKGVDVNLVILMLTSPFTSRVLSTREPIDDDMPAKVAAIVARGIMKGRRS